MGDCRILARLSNIPRMRRTLPLLALLLLPSFAAARSPAEGLVLRLEPGWAAWSLDGDKLRSQVGAHAGEIDPLLIQQTQDAFAMGLSVGYNILGHATLAVGIDGSGWDVDSTARGGAGIVTFTAAWHPVRLLDRSDPEGRWDASIFLGGGWGVMGEDRALDGLVLSTGIRGEFFPLSWLSVGASLRYLPLAFSRYVLHWNNDVAIALPEGSGGGLFLPAVSVALHAPVGG